MPGVLGDVIISPIEQYSIHRLVLRQILTFYIFVQHFGCREYLINKQNFMYKVLAPSIITPI